MTPDPKSAQFITSELPIDASAEMRCFEDNLYTLRKLVGNLKIARFSENNLCLEYNTYDHSLGIKFEYIDFNDHRHIVTATLAYYTHEGALRKYVCDYLYQFQGNNFDEEKLSVNSYAEDLMLKMWDNGIDAELCDYGRGLSFSSTVDKVTDVMLKSIELIVNNIKPMSWFYEKIPGWRFLNIYHQLNKILPLLKQEAADERWLGVKPTNFLICRDAHQANIKLIYTEEGLYEMVLSIGMEENGFDPDLTGEWLKCEYCFNIFSNDEEVKSYLESEHSEFFGVTSRIMEWINYKSLFACGEEKDTDFVIVLGKEWAYRKFCLLLDIMMPIRYRYIANKAFVSKEMLAQKEKIERMLGTEMEVVEDEDSRRVFNHGHFLEDQEPVHISYLGDCPF